MLLVLALQASEIAADDRHVSEGNCEVPEGPDEEDSKDYHPEYHHQRRRGDAQDV